MKNLPRTALLSASFPGHQELATAIRRKFPGLLCVEMCATALDSASLTLSFDLRLLLQAPADSAIDDASARQIRMKLIASGLPFSCLYGSATEALQQAESAIRQYAAQAGQAKDTQPAKRHTWHWNCENCSDSDCEHRLFSALQEGRTTGSASQ